MLETNLQTEVTLDPENWESMRKLAHKMLDDMLTYLETVRERPVWQAMPEELRPLFKTPLPVSPEPPEQVYYDFKETVMPYPMGNIHPRFWGWVMGNGTVMAMLADMLASGVNPNMGGGNHAAVLVELQVVDWLKEMMGFPSDASGLLVSGGSAANLIGLAVGRDTHAGFDVRAKGLRAGEKQLTLYGSKEMHSSLERAADLLGLGMDALRQAPVDADYRVDVEALHEMIRQDRANGYQPACVIGNAGTVNTGAIDDLAALADLAEREDLWFHVDGAFGAMARLSKEVKPRLNGMERADSLAFDLHKWMYLPFEAGCVLVRDRRAHRDSFALTPEYLAHHERGLASGAVWLSDYGFQLSRGFRALKVWMSLKEHGVRRYSRLIQQNIDQAHYLAGLVERTPELELLAPVSLNIVCFRYRQDGISDEALNQINQELLIRLHESGIAVPTYTKLGEKYALRAAITNHRSKREDFRILVDAVVRLGSEVSEKL